MRMIRRIQHGSYQHLHGRSDQDFCARSGSIGAPLWIAGDPERTEIMRSWPCRIKAYPLQGGAPMRRCFALAFVLALATGCSSQGGDEALQEADHTEGEYVHAANHPFLWTKDAEHKEMSFPGEDLSR